MSACIKNRLLDLAGPWACGTEVSFESAITQPRHTYFYANGDIFDIAAAYAYHIAEAQACFDGNKRTGVAAAFLFLELNAISTDFDSMPLYEAMIAIAERRMNKTQLAQLLRELCEVG